MPGPATPDDVQELADRLWRAQVERKPIAPLSQTRPELRLEDAYAIQTHNVRRRIAAGALARGHKVGLTSRIVQDVFGVNEPTFGILLDDMFLDEGAQVRFEELIQPRAAPELAFRIGADLTGPGVGTRQALAAIDGVLAAIGIADSRIADWRIRLVDTVADNASFGRLVLGARALPVEALDLRLVGVLFHRNGTPIDSGAGAAVLGHPARAVAWLANRLAGFGTGLRAGDVVLSGALHRMIMVRSGDMIRAEFAHLGPVSVSFSGGRAP